MREGLRDAGKVHIWARPLEDGSIAVRLLNLGDRDGRIATVAWESIGLHNRRPCRVRDPWSGQDLGEVTRELAVRVDRHDVALVRLVPAGWVAAPQSAMRPRTRSFHSRKP